MTSNVVQRTATRGGEVKTYGWIMNWVPFRSVDYQKIGEEFTVKTMFKKVVGFEAVSVYIGKLLVKDMLLVEKIHDMNGPVPVLVKGIKKGERVYNNICKNDIEGTNKLCWIYLHARGMQLTVVNEIPAEVMERFKIVSPPMTFKQYSTIESNRRQKFARQSRGSRDR